MSSARFGEGSRPANQSLIKGDVMSIELVNLNIAGWRWGREED